MESIISYDLKKIFTEQPTLQHLFVAISFITVALLLGLFIRKFLMNWLFRVAQKSRWKGDDVLLKASNGILEFFFVVGGLYLAVYYFPFIPRVESALFKVLEIISTLLITVISSRIAIGFINAYQDNQDRESSSSSLFVVVINVVVYSMGVLIILSSLGISIAPYLTALGVGGLAVALALQDTLSNVFAGLQILAAKNISPNDYIQLENGDEGYVIDINWRSTTIRALPNRMIIIPNNKLAASTVKNFSKPDLEISVLVDVGVSYNSDLEHVEQVTIDVAKSIMKRVEGGVTDFEPFTRYHTFDAYSINFSVIMRAHQFVDQYMIKHEFVKLLHKRYQEEGIEIPFPITTVMMSKSSESAIK